MGWRITGRYQNKRVVSICPAHGDWYSLHATISDEVKGDTLADLTWRSRVVAWGVCDVWMANGREERPDRRHSHVDRQVRGLAAMSNSGPNDCIDDPSDGSNFIGYFSADDLNDAGAVAEIIRAANELRAEWITKHGSLRNAGSVTPIGSESVSAVASASEPRTAGSSTT